MEPPVPKHTDWLADLGEKEAREAMYDFIAEHCCYGRQCAIEMIIEKIITTATLHYILETFTESRDVNFASEPYRGRPVDGPEKGVSPLASSITCVPESNFLNHQKKVEIPHTAEVKNCTKCVAIGNVQCGPCSGVGIVRCKACDGVGRVADAAADGTNRTTMCSCCLGIGRTNCITCNGTGRVPCPVCEGYRQLRWFTELTVTFKNNVGDYIISNSNLPDKLVREARGKKVFEQIDPQVAPITSHPHPEMNRISDRLIEEHRSSFIDSKKLMQRHRIRAVPVTEVVYTWRGTTRRYWVYGKERRVHAPDYPQKWCWGCTLI